MKWLLLLPVISIVTVLAQKMLIVQVLGNRSRFGIGSERLKRHRSDFFHNDRHMSCFRRRFAPAKRSMSRHKHGRRVERIEFCEPPNDRLPLIGLVVSADFRRRKRLGYRDWSMKIVRMGRAKTRNLASGLRPSCGRPGVRMRDPANPPESSIQNEMRRKIG